MANPSPTSPTTASGPTCMFSKYSWEVTEPRKPILSSLRPITRPGVSRCTMKHDGFDCPSSTTRANTVNQSPTAPFVMNILPPLMV